MSNQKSHPFVGMRIVKTVIAVYISVFITHLMGGVPVNSSISAFLALLPSPEDSYTYAKNRVIGTLVGGLFALVFVFSTDVFEIKMFTWYYYLAMSLMLIPIIKTGQLIGVKTIASACISFLVALVSYATDDDLKYVYVVSRIVDTMVGVLVAVAINIILPHRQNNPKLEGIDDDHTQGTKNKENAKRRKVNISRRLKIAKKQKSPGKVQVSKGRQRTRKSRKTKNCSK